MITASKSLKKRNQPPLFVFLLANVIVLGIAAVGTQTIVALLNGIYKGDFSVLTKVLALPAVASLVLGVMSWTVPKPWKETLVSWRVGSRRLPSSEAFTKVAPADLRIDMAQLAARLGALPIDDQKQSALWYATYRKHSKEAPVQDANSAYLLYREMTALVPLMFIAILILAAPVNVGWRTLAVACGGLVVEFLLVMFSARNAGISLVANVLAIEASRPQKPEPKTQSTTLAAKKREPRKAKSPGTPKD